MKRKLGALRQATDGARFAQMSAANDLVNRTLAQHGLGSSTSYDGAAMQDSMQSMMSRLQGMAGNIGQAVPGTSLPGMQPGSYTCAAGTRRYRTYVPETTDQGLIGMVVMLHGCTQNPEDFAIGTGMNALADKHGFAVLYPEQSRGDNAQSCWNWFSIGDQRRDRGEPSILAGMTRQVAKENEVPAGRIYVAGLSAGGAMAVILGETYPELFSAVGAHSGLPAGAARDVPSAFAAMAGNGPDIATPVAGTQTVRTIVFHGAADATVHPVNGERIYRHALNRGAAQTLHSEEDGTAAGRRYQRKVVAGTDGAATLDYWVVEGLGHAWSGGKAAGSYTDASGPDASSEMVRFFFQTDGGAL